MSSSLLAPVSALALGLTLLTACSGYGLDPFDTSATLDSTTGSGSDTGSDPGDLNPGKDSQTDDSDTGPVDPVPAIVNFSVTEYNDKARFTFELVDEDGDMEGGSITIEAAGYLKVYEYDDQVAFTDGDTPFVAWSLDLFEPETPYPCTLYATDSAGNVSNTASATFTRSAWSVEVEENGDTLDDVYGVGIIEVPATISGSLHSTGNDGANYTGDLDVTKFRVPEIGTYTIVLTWDNPSADYDLFLMEAGPTTLTSSATFAYPESVTYPLQAGEDYFLAVAGWSGSPGAWSIRIEQN